MKIELKFLKTDDQSMAKIHDLLSVYKATMELAYGEEKISRFRGSLKGSLLNVFEEILKKENDRYEITLDDLNHIEALHDSLASAAFKDVVNLSKLRIVIETSPVQLKEPILNPAAPEARYA